MSRIASRLLSATLLMALCACAAPPLEPTAERVDESTGVSVSRLAHPVELLATTAGGRADPFAYVAPFETNRMGERALYIWMASQQAAANPDLALLADGEPVVMGEAVSEIGSTGLSKSPYELPAPWSVERFYRTNREAIERLARASRVELVVRDAEGVELRYAATGPALADMAQFITQLD